MNLPFPPRFTQPAVSGRTARCAPAVRSTRRVRSSRAIQSVRSSRAIQSVRSAPSARHARLRPALSSFSSLHLPLALLLPAVLLFAPARDAAAGPAAYLVKDVNQSPSPAASSNPSALVKSKDVLYFAADDGVNGRELWTTNGDVNATTLFKDIYPGATSSDPRELLDVEGKLFFSAAEPRYGRELWVHDPATTQTPTRRVKDIFDGPTGSDPDTLTAYKNSVVFRANDDDHGKELWKSDGTTANTSLIIDIRPGSGGSYPQLLTPVGNYVYFRADDNLGLFGMELWRTNLDAKGTVRVADINPGGGGSYPNSLAALGNLLFFRASDGDNAKKGYELWKSDAASTATQRVKDIWPGDPSSDPRELVAIGNVILFSADDGTHGRELWKTTGTAEGTTLVKDIAPGSAPSSPTRLFPLGASVFFVANETDTTFELWKSNGSEDGTIRLRTFKKGPTPPAGFESRWLAAQDQLVFPAYDPTFGWEMWKSDGTVNGTQVLVDVVAGSGSSHAFPLYDHGWTMFFSADDGTHGRELWRVVSGNEIAVDPPKTLSFGFSTTGTLRIPAVTVHNQGWSKNLTFAGNGLRLDGADASAFAIKTSPLPPSPIPPGESRAIEIDFTPSSMTKKTATLVITTDDTDEPSVSIQLIALPLYRAFLAH